MVVLKNTVGWALFLVAIYFPFFLSSTCWMLGNTPPEAMVTPLSSLFNSSSLRTANCQGRGQGTSTDPSHQHWQPQNEMVMHTHTLLLLFPFGFNEQNKASAALMPKMASNAHHAMLHSENRIRS